MKFMNLLFIILVCGLLFLVAKPKPPMKQAQEAENTFSREIGENTYRITRDIESEDDRPVADILWFQAAAELAIDNNNPWFNVLEQQIGEKSVDGVIQLEKNPMKAEYDANEILSLDLAQETRE